MIRSLVIAMVLTFPTLTAGQSRGVHVETGLQGGAAFGVEGPSFSTWRAFTEIGYMLESSPNEGGNAWGGGATFLLSVGTDDALLGLKPRVRYRFDPQWSVDVSAGLILAGAESEPGVSTTGFIGGVHLNYGTWLTMRGGVNVRETVSKDWGWDSSVDPERGYETAVYGGLALREKAGWIATATGAIIFAGFMLAMAASGIS